MIQLGILKVVIQLLATAQVLLAALVKIHPIRFIQILKVASLADLTVRSLQISASNVHQLNIFQVLKLANYAI